MLTPEQAKERLRIAGISLSQVARELRVSQETVRSVLSGRLKGSYGKSHRVAVALGIKKGVIVPPETPFSEALKRAGGAK